MAAFSRSRRAGGAPSHVHLLLLSPLAAALAAGCAQPDVPAAALAPQQVEAPKATAADKGERIADDPVAFLREVYDRAAAMDEYRLTFYRQERTGLIPRLGKMEEIRAKFRAQPFSVKFVWDNPDDDYHESLYVAGQNGDKLIVRERKGLLGLPPQTRVLDVMEPVKWGKSKNPVTDFGLAQVTRRTLLPFEDPQVSKVMTIAYMGVVNLDPIGRPAHHVRVERPPMKDFRYTRQDFYVDTETLLPAGTDLYTQGNKLDARYRYADVDANVEFTDADFRINSAQAAAKGDPHG